MTATKIQPGDDTHLTLLMAPHSLNFVTGADRAALLAYGRDVFAEARASQCLAQIEEPAGAAPAAVAHWPQGEYPPLPEPVADWVQRGSVSTGGGSLGHEIGREGVFTAAQMRAYFDLGRQAAPALEAPAAPDAPPLTPDEARRAARFAELWNGPSDATSGSQYAMAGALAFAAKLAAAPQAPAAPDPRTPADMLVNGGALKLALNVLRRAGKNEVADELEKTAAPAAPAVDALSQAARDVLAERQRQISAEGYEPEADDMYESGELARAAATYALLATGDDGWRVEDNWPWGMSTLKRAEPRRMLEKAGALILADMERIDRAAQAKEGGA